MRQSIDKEFTSGLLARRDSQGHKGTFGHLLLVAGSHGMMGAALLAARSALRSGIGKLTAHIPSGENVIMQIGVPEALAQSDTLSSQHWAETVNLREYSAMVIGPGIGKHPDTVSALNRQLDDIASTRDNLPLLLDADAVNIIAGMPSLLDKLPPKCVITPHLGEMKRLLNAVGDFSAESLEDYIQAATSFATKYNLVVVLKSYKTHVCTPNGAIFYTVGEGNSGLATAGSGDVLAGIIGGLLTQGYTPEHAALSGVYLHATAGAIAVTTKGEHSLIASDIISTLPAAFLTLD